MTREHDRFQELLEKFPVPHSQVVSETVDDTVIVVHLGTGYSTILKEVAADLWRLIDGKSRLSQIVSKLLRVYNVARERCEADVVRFTLSMEECQLIFLQSAPAGAKRTKGRLSGRKG